MTKKPNKRTKKDTTEAIDTHLGMNEIEKLQESLKSPCLDKELEKILEEMLNELFDKFNKDNSSEND